MKQESRFLTSLLWPLFFSLLLWIIFYAENYYQLKLYRLGIIPREWEHIYGILTMPLLHADFAHVFSNTFPFLILSTLVNYYYPEISKKIFLFIYIFTGILVWCFGDWDHTQQPKASFHIGASGIIYGLSGFLFLSGIIRRRKDLFGISLLVTFLYGTIIWGVFPETFQKAIHYISEREKISWEGHLFGFLTGCMLAYKYRHVGLQKEKYEWEADEEKETDEENPYWMENEDEEIK